MSEARALTNLVGNGVATIIVGKWGNDVDMDRLNKVLDNKPVAEIEHQDEHEAMISTAKHL